MSRSNESSKKPGSRNRFHRRRRPSGSSRDSSRGASEIQKAARLAKDLPLCERCAKPMGWLCLCEGIAPEATSVRVLILQHPQEPDKLLGTAPLLALHLENAQLRVGLSWPNLKQAWGEGSELDPKRWAVLYLGGSPGGGASAKGASASSAPQTKAPPAAPRLTFVDKKGVPLAPDEQAAIGAQLQGLVVLDGTWSQAKALWWRNAWLLKLRRCRLDGGPKSLYGELRKEPRRECLSTLEATARTLTALGASPALQKRLETSFEKLLSAYRDGLSKAAASPQEDRDSEA